jgi:hypothetical protein
VRDYQQQDVVSGRQAKDRQAGPLSGRVLARQCACAVAVILLAGGGARGGGSAALGQEQFLDVVVKNRFFRMGESTPSIAIRTRSPVYLDCVAYDRFNQPVALWTEKSFTNHFTLALEHLPEVPKGVYLFCLAVRNESGQLAGLYPKAPGGGEIITVKESAVEADKREINYVLPKAACVRVRAGFHEGLYLGPIISALAQPAGRHTVSWNGASRDGVFTNLYANPQVEVNILAVSLPVNILVAEGGGRDVSTAGIVLPSHLSSLTMPAWIEAGASPRDYLIAEDYNLQLAITEDATTRIAETRVNCGGDERPRLFSKRFELMLFLDTAFLMEDERSQMPFSYRMSTRGLTPGRHVLTANVVDADGSVGTASTEFTIRTP